MRVGIVMDPLERIHFAKDSTLGICLLAQQYGWRLEYIPAVSLESLDGAPRASAAPLKVFDNQDTFYRLGDFNPQWLADYDLLLMRQDPPVDQRYSYHLMLLASAARQGVLVANNPDELLARNEKLGANEFPEFSPPSLVSSDIDTLRAFAARQGEVIVKPLDGMGGRGIFHLRKNDRNTGVVFETLSSHGSQLIMAQGFIPQVREGDKRIFLFDGEPWPWCLARIPQTHEARANLATGGRGETRELTVRDREIAEGVGKKLKGKGLFFVGLDVIGDYLTEVNITSPTGVREVLRDTGENPLEKLLEVINVSLKKPVAT